MPRKARRKSDSGIYHIIMRGINRQIIFNEDEDYHKFLLTLEDYQKISEYTIYGYCLMDNHIHLLLKVGTEPLEQVMRRICGRYVYWYNQKYERAGYLFQDRFKSEPVENDLYLLTVLRYIHQNPLKAGMIKDLGQFSWSSYREYLNEGMLADIDFVLNIFDHDRKKAVKKFIEFNQKHTNDKCLEIYEKYRLSDKEALKIIKRVCKLNNPQEIQSLNIKTRNTYLKKLKDHDISIRQIERLTGVNRGVIYKI